MKRTTVRQANEQKRPRKPGPLFALNDPILDDPTRLDEAFKGFGSSCPSSTTSARVVPIDRA